jgi:hypothetical protein
MIVREAAVAEIASRCKEFVDIFERIAIAKQKGGTKV